MTRTAVLPRPYDAMVRKTNAFQEAVAQTLAELAHRGVTLTPATVEDTIERNVQAVANQLGIQVRSAWRYFDAAALADSMAQSVQELDASSGVGVLAHVHRSVQAQIQRSRRLN